MIMKHTVTMTTEEVQEAVREYLERRGYDCGCRSANMADVAKVQFNTENGISCVVENLKVGNYPKPDCPDCGGNGYIDDGNNELPCRRCFPHLSEDWLRKHDEKPQPNPDCPDCKGKGTVEIEGRKYNCACSRVEDLFEGNRG